MAQSGYTPILIYASGTATNVPLAANMTSSASGAELALNYADGKLYYKNSSGVVTLLASSTTVTNSFSAGTTGFTPSTATTGAVTLGGTLITSNGGTGLASYTAGDLSYYASGTALTKLAIGTAGQFLTSTGTAPQWSTLSGVAVTTFSAGTTGFTPNTATSGAITLAGTLATTNGGTGLTSFTSGGVVYASSSSALATGSALTFDGTKLGVGITPVSTIHSFVADGGYVFGLSGTTKGLRVSTDSAQTLIQGVDNTLIGSYQPLTLGGSILVFQANGTTEGMRLTSTGLGIGTSSPVSKLQSVDGDITVTTSASFVGFNSTRAGVPTATGQQLGRLNFNAYSTGTTYVTGASVQAYSNAAWSSTSAPSYLSFQTTPSSSTSLVERLVIDSKGILGVGVTPRDWGSDTKAIQMAGSTFSAISGDARLTLLANSYWDGTNWIYTNTGSALQYRISAGTTQHEWYVAPSGTTGATITTGFTTPLMTLDVNGNLKTTSPASTDNIVTINSTSTNVSQRLNFTANGTIQTQIYDDSTESRISAVTSKPLTFRTVNAERGRFDTSGNLLVGISSAMNGIGSDGKIGLQLSGSVGNFVVQNSADNNFYLAKINGYTNSTFMVFSVNGTNAGNITTNGTSLQLDKISAITFPATQVASASANTLDDYEEGTWSPSITFGGNAVGVSYNATYNRGWYTKVGRLVTCTMALEVQNKGSSTGDLNIGGFPFSSTLGDASVSHCVTSNNITVTSGPLSAYGTLFTGVLAVVRQVSGSPQAAITDADCGSSFSILATIVYLV